MGCRESVSSVNPQSCATNQLSVSYCVAECALLVGLVWGLCECWICGVKSPLNVYSLLGEALSFCVS